MAVNLEPTMGTNPPARDRELWADIASFGWSVIKHERSKDHPPLAYSIGFYEGFAHPEVIITGLDDLNLMHQISNTIGFAIREGKRFSAGSEYPGIIIGYECAFQTVHPTWIQELMTAARALYGREDFPALQCFWPDTKGRFPWHDDYQQAWRTAQPLLSAAVNEPATAPLHLATR